MLGIVVYQNPGVWIAFAILIKPINASETILNEYMIHSSWSLWATYMGSATFTIRSGCKNYCPWPASPLDGGTWPWTHRTYLLDWRMYNGFLFPQKLPYPCTLSFSRTPFQSCSKDWRCCFLRCREDISVKEKLTKDKSNTTDFAGRTSIVWHKRIGSVFLYETSMRSPICWGKNRD